METIILTIKVSKNIYAILKEKAEMCGVSVEEYVVCLLEKHVGEQPTGE